MINHQSSKQNLVNHCANGVGKGNESDYYIGKEEEVTELVWNDNENSEKTINRCNKTGHAVSLMSSCSVLDSKNEIDHWDIGKMDSSEEKVSWNDINEVIESDFLISPGDIYPNRKVQLQDEQISEETKEKFEEMCDLP